MPSRRSIAVAAVSATVCTALWYCLTYAWLPEGASTISLLHAAETFGQCSRDLPFNRGPYWVPAASQIREIEPSLHAMPRQAPPRFGQAQAGTLFTRQYIGFTRDGKRLIYVNVVVNDWPFEEHLWFQHLEHFVDGVLPERPVIMCDGGIHSWSVVYDPATKKFESPLFIGPHQAL